jgi:hypothetical protein
VAYAWMPGARCIRAKTDGGPLLGGAPRAVWLTLGTEARDVSVTSAAQRLNAEGRPCHLVWDPRTGEIAQLVPVVRAGGALGTRDHLGYEPDCVPLRPARVNREGRLCVQIGVLGTPRDPFTAHPMAGLAAILRWLDSWQIPRRWPAGQPAAYRQALLHLPAQSRALWAHGGHYGASQVPGSTTAGPGGIDIALLFSDQAAGPIRLGSISQRHQREAPVLSAAR